MAITPVFADGEAIGLDNPTLAYNLGSPAYYETGLQFLDLMKMMREWTLGWDDMSVDELKAGGYLDEDGWIVKIPPGGQPIRTAWSGLEGAAAEDREGVYVLTYEGEGKLNLGNVTVLSSEPGRIVFENTNGSDDFWLEISQTDPNGSGDYIRDISIVKEENLALFEAGAVFNPEWLELIGDARQIRFMDWQKTNSVQSIDWSERTTANGVDLGNGASVEDMVRLANEIGADPWFCMPADADEEYIRNFATYVRDNLDPSLTVRVEYSNEIWNWSFEQTSWLRDQANAEWGQDSWLDYAAKKAVENALIWKDVFSGGDADRLVNVLGSQADYIWVTEELLDAPVWKQMEPGSYVDPKTVFDEVAITTYFGGSVMTEDALRKELLAAIRNPSVDASQFLAEKLMDPNYSSSIPNYYEEFWSKQAALVESAGLKLTAYEGGQHILQSFGIDGISDADQKLLTDFLTEFVRSDEMGMLYRELWDVWSELSDGPFMQYYDVGVSSKWGAWGVHSNLEDSTPRSEVLDQLNGSTPWWDAKAGTQYQQGVVSRGTDGDDMLTGTAQEDFLLGGKGNDMLFGAGGSDGINGGEGDDRALFSGNAPDYQMVAEGAGYRITGPDGSDFLINIESVGFEDGSVYSIAQMLAGEHLNGGGGTPVPQDPAPQEPAPQDPAPQDPVPQDPVPQDPVPQDPAPQEPTPQDPGPQDPVPQDPAPDTGENQDPPPVEPEPEPEYALLGWGQHLDAEHVALSAHRGRGLIVEGVNAWSSLGQELGLHDSGTAAYVVTDERASIKVGRSKVEADYWSMQENRNGSSGKKLGDSALDTALKLGSVASGVERLALSDKDDVFLGGGWADAVAGGAGDDWIDGRDGDDLLEGGAGDDTLIGGGGADHFVFAAGSGHDRVLDFSVDDVLDLDGFSRDPLTIYEDRDANLVLSNGDDTITLVGLGLDDFEGIARAQITGLASIG